MDDCFLRDQALALHPVIHDLVDQYDLKYLTDFDLVGSVILAYLSFKRPRKYLGRLSRPVSVASSSSRLISTLPASFLQIISLEYIARKLKVDPISISVMTIFNEAAFIGIKGNKNNYINTSLVEWALGARPYILMFHIPTPMEVLRQQASGMRVVTVFKEFDELLSMHTAMLYYMKGEENHAKTSIEFTLHDLKHMELFVDDDIFHEQVGFFRCFLRLGADAFLSRVRPHIDLPDISELSVDTAIEVSDSACSRPRMFFIDVCNLDLQLWRELEYVISDMNCYSTHLLRYFFAKLYLAVERRQGDMVERSTENYWKVILIAFGMRPGDNTFEASMSLIDTTLKRRGPLTADEGDAIRVHFKALGSK